MDVDHIPIPAGHQWLPDVHSLEAAVAQVEDGTVARFRTLYGPREKAPRKEDQEKTPDHWENIKSTVTRRERLYGILRDHFKGDKPAFYAFFSGVTVSDLTQTVNPKFNKGIKKESGRAEYYTDGQYSEEKWVAKWGDKNDYEVWRALNGGNLPN